MLLDKLQAKSVLEVATFLRVEQSLVENAESEMLAARRGGVASKGGYFAQCACLGAHITLGGGASHSIFECAVATGDGQ